MTDVEKKQTGAEELWIGVVSEYTPELAERLGELLQDLSQHYKGGAVPREVIEEFIESPWHDIVLAVRDEKIVGMLSVSVVMGALIHKNAYLEDFVVDARCQGGGVGTALFRYAKAWGRRKGCARLEFTSSGKGKKRQAVDFYLSHGASIRDTNAFRVEL